jgi:Na+-driven multidrug efflux pump
LLIVAALGASFAPLVIRLFRKEDEEVVRIGALALRLQCATLPLFGLVTISNMMMQTLAQTVRASVVALSRQGLFFIPLILLLPRMLGLLGIQLAQPISDLFTFALTLILQAGLLRTLRTLDEKNRAAVGLHD